MCRFLFFFFFANVFSPSNVSTPYAYDYIASRARCKVVSCSTRSRDRERERDQLGGEDQSKEEGERVVKVREIRRSWRGKVFQVTSVG